MQEQDTTTRRIILTFPDMTSLWSFTDTLISDFIEINARTMSIITACSDRDLQRAVSVYGATVYNDGEQQ